MALATDLNPGSSPVYSLLTTLNLGCLLFALTVDEALAGVTRVAAQALGLADRGIIMSGRRADLVAWEVGHPRELIYALGLTPPHRRMWNGRWTNG